MCPGGAEAAALGSGDLRDVAAKLCERVHHVACCTTDGRRHLEHRLHQFRVQAFLVLAVLDCSEH